MGKTNLILAESPLQLLNAYEAIYFFELKKYRIILRFSGVTKNDAQLSRLLETLDLNPENVERISINNSGKTLFDIAKLALISVKFLFRKKKIERLFVGNYNSGFFSLIYKGFKKSQIVLMDDGSLTLEIQKAFSDKLSLDLFTIYDIKPHKHQNIYQNSFAQIKIRLMQDLFIDNKSILFLGGGLSEIHIISSTEYMHLIAQISTYYGAKGKNVLYIPHRNESVDKVSMIGQLANVEVFDVNYPVELYGIFEKRIPATVASFYSTALISMRNIYNLEVECFRFNYKKSKYKEEIDSVYDYYEKEMNVISLVD